MEAARAEADRDALHSMIASETASVLVINCREFTEDMFIWRILENKHVFCIEENTKHIDVGEFCLTLPVKHGFSHTPVSPQNS